MLFARVSHRVGNSCRKKHDECEEGGRKEYESDGNIDAGMKGDKEDDACCAE